MHHQSQEKELMKELFPGKRQKYKLHPQHLGLPAVLKHVPRRRPI